MSVNEDEVPVKYVMARFAEVQEAVGKLDQKIDDKLGDFAVRMAKVELRLELHDKAIETGISGRRWGITTVIAAVSVLVAVGALLVAILSGG